MTSRSVKSYRFGPFEVDPSARSVTDSGRPVAISSRVFDLLLHMVRNPGRLLTKEELLTSVWADLAVEEGNLSQSVFLLRKVLSGSSATGPLIVTVPGRGYQFAAPVEEIASGEQITESPSALRPGNQVPEIAANAAEVPAPLRRSRRTGWRPFWLVAAGIVAPLLAFAGWVWFNRPVPGDHHESVLADFEDETGEPGVGKALNVALSIDLKQSPYLQVAPDAKTRKTLTLMQRSPQENLTPPLAREVCQRIGDRAVLSGIIARFGQKHLITLTASDCVSGQDLAQTKAVANGRDDIPRAVDEVAADMRRRLGEPLKSVRQFNKPLLPKQTGSLEALKAYTQGHELGLAGKFQESIPFFRRAVELDPRFAIAWGDLGVIYGDLGEPTLSAEANRKAFQLRDLADEPDRFFISATYYENVTGDLHESIRNYEQWTETYARYSSPWANLANAETLIGRPDLAIEPARRALALNSANAVAYTVLARAQMRVGQIDQALATCQQAIVQKLDSAQIHGLLLSIGFAQRDRAATDEQVAWAKGTSSEPYMALQQFQMLFAEGRPKAGLDLFTQMTDGFRQNGMQERAKRMSGGVPRLEAELGMTDAARRLLDRIPPIDGSTDMPVAMAEVGEDSKAEAILQHHRKEFPEDTLWQYVKGPQIEAAIALSRNKPQQAIEALRPSIPYDQTSSELPAMRGRAYLAARQFAQAEAEFRKIVDHPTVDPLSANVTLAHLGLARARTLAGDAAGGREEYEKFLALWKDAEPDVQVLREARAEYMKLSRTGP
jgi:eukaryotic-like serine/threonine-protein kinase